MARGGTTAWWRRFLLILLIVMPSYVPAAVAQSTGEFDITIEVVPGPASPNPAAGSEPANPQGAVSAGVFGVGFLSSPGAVQTVALDVVVADHRQSAGGWIVRIMMPGDDGTARPFVLSRYLHRAVSIDGQAVHESAGPRGTRLSVGQPLDRLTPVIVADPGAGAGTYTIRIAVAGEVPEPEAIDPLVISVDSAP